MIIYKVLIMILIDMISPNKMILFHQTLNPQTPMNPYPCSVHHYLPRRCLLRHCLRQAQVQVDASAELVACGGQGDSDHPPVPNRARVAMGGASWRGDAQDTPGSLHVCSAGVGCQNLEEVGWMIFSSVSSTLLIGPQPWWYFFVWTGRALKASPP